MINQENTYLGADGLAYCKICGEPVEAFFPCMIIRKLIITRFLSFNIVVQYNSDTMDF